MAVKTDSPYQAQITREQFLFFEMRTTAKLLSEGLDDNQVIEQIVTDNLFQYPTEKTVKQLARNCIKRLRAMEDETLISAIASQPVETAKQICLYAMMRESRLVWDFMITVIGRKYQSMEFSFGKMDVNVFMMQLQEQDDYVASWSDSTVTKIKQVLMRLLVENEYLDNIKADRLNPVWLNPILENAIREAGQEMCLPAFNCLT